AVRLREQPRRRDREDALRPLLREASLGVAGSADPLRHRESRRVRPGIEGRRRQARTRARAHQRAATRHHRGRRLMTRMRTSFMTMERELAGKIETRTARVAVIGQGYVGLPLAL